jgi:hypothetical protein
MEAIAVTRASDGSDRFTVDLRGTDGVPSEHEVRVSDTDWNRFGGGFDSPEALVEASFRFLLEREPKDSILREFALGVIERYFPDYAETFTPRS